MIRMNKVLYNHCLCVLKKKHTFSLKFNDKMPVMFWFSTFHFVGYCLTCGILSLISRAVYMNKK